MHKWLFWLGIVNVVHAQPWPIKPVRLIVGFPTGGSTDLVARYMAEPLSPLLGQQVIVDNRGGANGAMGAAIAARAAPDGYTFMVVYDSHATNPALQKSMPFDTLRDFAPVMLIASSPMVLVVGASSPYRALSELISTAKAKPWALTLGSGGHGSRGHLAMALLSRRAGFEFTAVPYKGGTQLLVDLISGQITMQVGSVFLVSPHLKSQRMRALAVTAPVRLAQLPDIPAIAEQGFPGYEVQTWWGMVMPTGVPRPIAERMHASLARALSQAQTRDRLEQLGMDIRASTPEVFGRHIASEMALWGKVVRETNIAVSGTAP